MRRFVVVGLTLALGLGLTVPAAGAATRGRTVRGTMTGAGSFVSKGCPGVISYEGSGSYAARGLGRGTYSFDVCVDGSAPSVSFSGTVTFTNRHGATLTGSVGGNVSSPWPTFAVTVTSGTRRFARAAGTLTLGPLVESNQTDCDPRAGVCLHWTDQGPISGTLTGVRHRRGR